MFISFKFVIGLFVFKGDGVIKNFPGNYTIFRESEIKKEKEQPKKIKENKPKKEKPINNTPRKFSFKEKREFEELEKDLELLNTEKTELEAAMSSGALSNQDLMEKSQRIQKVIELIDEKELQWLELSEFI